jgi:glucose/arabinose dehydrogenase
MHAGLRLATLLAGAVFLQNLGSARAETMLTTVLVTGGLTRPAFVTAAPGDTSRIFIVEQRGSDNRGRIKIVKHGVLLARPFLTTAVLSTGFEQGLLGLAFAPNYATTGRFYINYTRADGTTIVERHNVSADPDSANPTGTAILTVPQPFANHNGGWLGFGPDGYLYVALGDGGDGGDPGDRAQNLNTLLGKLLRIDVSGATYSIPPDNPFAGATNGLDEIWAYGLRNPWRPAFDRATGDLVIADVGQGQFEEIDFQPASSDGGENYGWRCYEASAFFSESATIPCGSCLAAGCPKIMPSYEYSHALSHCSVTGGYVYRGSAIPSLVGTYFFGDYCAGTIYSGRFVGDTLVFVHNRTAELAPGGGLDIVSITSFGEDASGELYICDQGGEVFKIVPGTVTGVESEASPLSSRRLFLEPVPFRSDLRIILRMNREEQVRVNVFDVHGRRVRTILDGEVSSGQHALFWDGRTLSGTEAPAGIYFVRFEGKDRNEVLRAVRMR